MKKFNKYKKLFEKDQQTIKCFDKLYRKSLQDNLIDKLIVKVYLTFLLNMSMNRKMSLFYKHEDKKKIKFFQ